MLRKLIFVLYIEHQKAEQVQISKKIVNLHLSHITEKTPLEYRHQIGIHRVVMEKGRLK